jgi:hypothetical protein
MPRRQTAEKGAAQRPSQLTFEPMPLHAVGRWSCEQTRVEAVEQLLFGSVRTGRPLLVCSAFEADVRVALEAQAKAQQLLGECAEEVPEDGPAATLPFAPDLPYRVVRRLRQGWEACPPELASRLAASLPRWLAPRAGGDLLSTLPSSAAAQTHALAAFLLPPSEAGRAQDDTSAAAHYFYLVGGGDERGGGEVRWPSEAATQQGFPFPVHCARQQQGTSPSYHPFPVHCARPRPSALLPRAATLQP